MVSKASVVKKLKTVLDPELQVSIYDLGLIYEIRMADQGEVHILMTLTSIGCPLFSVIQTQVEESVKTIPGVQSVSIDLTFDPPWSMEKMSQEAKDQLGLS